MIHVYISRDSSVGRAEDCSGILLSLGHWFESGSRDFLNVFFFVLVLLRLYGPEVSYINTY